MKFVFINRYFHPDVAPTGLHAADVAFDWSAAGHEVHAVTSRLAYDGAGAVYAAEESVAGVRIHRLPTTRFGRGRMAGRICDYATFYLLAAWWLLRHARRGDVLIAKTDPPLIAVVAAMVARMRGVRVVNWVQDLFPEVAARSGIRLLEGPLGRVATALRNWSFARASLNVAVGNRMAGRIAALVPGARVRVVPNWSDGASVAPVPREANALRCEWGFGHRFVVGYSGNLGRAHDWRTLLEAARLLAARGDIHFAFIGSGHHFSELRAAGLPNISIRGYVPNERLAEGLAASDVHLVSLLPEFEGLVVPSKFYGILAAGRPVIHVGDPDGELARVVAEHRCGIAIASGDAEGLAAAIARLSESRQRCETLGMNGRAAFLAHWDKPVALQRWREVLACVGGGVPPASPGAPESDVCI